ncbi:hypothetical protein [Natrinema salinisoli]|uniref:hypothetical protein n=1 Tax=Natrinema salinisoli TaxID=2878535 RepID=UPI001CEFE4EE|nr:hypothetical protein [Natrinema salinisoli]
MTFVLVNHDDEEYVEFDNDKSTHFGGDGTRFTNQMVAEYMKMASYEVRNGRRIQLIARDEKFYEEIHDEYDNATCDVLYSMFEAGYVPNSNWVTGWIFTQFKQADRMDHLKKWMDDW